MTGHLFDMDGAPITTHEWAALFEAWPARRIARDRVGDVEVSTVWDGIDHRFGRPGAPLIFETMMFGGEHDGWSWRYPTREAALAGHDQAVALARDQTAAGGTATGA